MINLKKLFRSNPYLVPVSRQQKELLEYFVANKLSFENWFCHRPQQRVRFQFYYPTAIDFFFDEFHLFTAYFKKGQMDAFELSELKMTNTNFTTIRSGSWKPFEEVLMQFLESLEEQKKSRFFHKTRSLQEYTSICNETAAAAKEEQKRSPGLSPSIAAG